MIVPTLLTRILPRNPELLEKHPGDMLTQLFFFSECGTCATVRIAEKNLEKKINILIEISDTNV